MAMIGTEDLIELLKKMSDKERIKQAVAQACLLVERDAKMNCPVQTGELRASITSAIVEDGDTILGEVGTPLMYGNYVEYGTGLFSSNGLGRTNVPWWYEDAEGEWHQTVGQMPQPFLIPALNNNRTEVNRVLFEGVFNGEGLS